MSAPLLRTEALSKRFGGLVATDDLSIDVAAGEIHAVIGPNGAGKTTLIAQLSGALAPDSGRILFDGADITALSPPQRCQRGLARSFQVTSIFAEFTARQNVALAAQAREGHSFRFWANADRDVGLNAIADGRLAQVGLAGREEVIAANLSHGEQRQLEIAMALATSPRLLLLDEPMAGMGVEESARMVALLRQLRDEHTIVLIEHDMDAVFALADRITVLVYGRAIASGNPDEIRENREVREAYLGDESG